MQTRRQILKLTIIFLALFLADHSAFSMSFPQTILSPDSNETKILDTIAGLPEVKKLADKIESLSDNKRHIKIFINSTPTKTQKYYWVKVAEDNGTNLVSYYNFFVFQRTLDIKYFDTVKDKIITLETWRKTRKE